MNRYPQADQVGVVVSAFHPPTSLPDGVRGLLKQADAVVVVDDGSPEQYEPVLDACRAAGAVVVRQTSNGGIAAALNAGIARIRQHRSVDFILTMDQDSELSAGYVSAMVDLAEKAHSAGLRVGMIGPGRIHGTIVRSIRRAGDFTFGGEPIQSGLMIPVDVIDDLSGFAERLFIDLVDSEFFLRATTKGYSCLLCGDAELDHQLGTMTPATLFGKPVRIMGRSVRIRTAATWRYYYIVRNRILVIRDYGCKHPWWSIKGILADLRHIAIAVALAPGRVGRISNAMSGLVDGIRGISGKRTTSAP